MSRAHYIADTRFADADVARQRGFASAQEHDQAILDRWFSWVGRDDEVFVLGNLSRRDPRYALGLIAQLPGRKHLIAGPHDPVHPSRRGAVEALPEYGGVFETVRTFARRTLAGHIVLLSHFPYVDPGLKWQPHREHRLADQGKWLVCGEARGEWTVSGRQVNVGVDVWGMGPAPEDQVAALIAHHAGPPGLPSSWT